MVNEKLSHCKEVVEMMNDHINTEQGHRLEWIIIVLIAIEIVFELIHVYERKFGTLTFLEPRPPRPSQEEAVAELLAEGAAPATSESD